MTSSKTTHPTDAHRAGRFLGNVLLDLEVEHLDRTETGEGASKSPRHRKGGQRRVGFRTPTLIFNF